MPDEEKVLGLLQRIYAIELRREAQYFLDLGNSHFQARTFEGAIIALKRCVATKEPLYVPLALGLLTNIYRALGQLEEVKLYQQQIVNGIDEYREMAPGEVIGGAYNGLRRYSDATEWYRKSASFAPHDALRQLNLAENLIITGKIEEAGSLLSRLSQTPKNLDLQMVYLFLQCTLASWQNRSVEFTVAFEQLKALIEANLIPSFTWNFDDISPQIREKNTVGTVGKELLLNLVSVFQGGSTPISRTVE